MTSKQIIAGCITVVVFLAFIGVTVITNGWALFVLMGLLVLAAIFMAGSSLVGD